MNNRNPNSITVRRNSHSFIPGFLDKTFDPIKPGFFDKTLDTINVLFS